jgi:hypothetical protein
MMKCKLGCAVSALTLATGLIGAATASAEGAANGQGNNCHSYILQYSKNVAGTNSTAATAAFYGVTVQAGQETIASDCSMS